MRSTDPAAIRPSSSRRLVLLLGRCPSISTLPAVAPKPRRSAPSSRLKPGSWRTMSSAVMGLNRAKKAGSNVWTASSADAAWGCCVVSCASAVSPSANALTARTSARLHCLTMRPPLATCDHVAQSSFFMCESGNLNAYRTTPRHTGDWGIPLRSIEKPTPQEVLPHACRQKHRCARRYRCVASS